MLRPDEERVDAVDFRKRGAGLSGSVYMLFCDASAALAPSSIRDAKTLICLRRYGTQGGVRRCFIAGLLLRYTSKLVSPILSVSPRRRADLEYLG